MSTYKLAVDQIIQKINTLDAKITLLQFPEGLKTYATRIAEEIEQSTKTHVIISADPCYGACDILPDRILEIADLVVHYGHTPLPLNYKKPTLFIEAYSRADVYEAIDKALLLLKDKQKIVLATTTQHLHIIDEVKDYLDDQGKEIIIKKGKSTRKGQVLGCNFSSIKKTQADAYLFIGSGTFHALGIQLFTKKPTIIADPYRQEAYDIEDFADRTLRIRFAKIVAASEAKSWGILVSTKEGQYRMSLALKISKTLRKLGHKTQIITINNFHPDALLPFTDIDAFIVTACPRIAIDDASMYNKPLITPQELEIITKKREWENYQLDEIIFEDAYK